MSSHTVGPDLIAVLGRLLGGLGGFGWFGWFGWLDVST